MYHWHKTFFCWGLIYWIPLVAEIKHWQAVNAHSLKFKVSHEHHFNFNTFLMLPLTIWVLMSLSLIGLHSFIMSGLLQLPVFWPPCWYTSHPPNPKPLISRCMTVMSPPLLLIHSDSTFPTQCTTGQQAFEYAGLSIWNTHLTWFQASTWNLTLKNVFQTLLDQSLELFSWEQCTLQIS